VYWEYLKRYGFTPATALLFAWSGEQTLNMMTQVWLSWWTQAELVSMIDAYQGEWHHRHTDPVHGCQGKHQICTPNKDRPFCSARQIGPAVSCSVQ
jgi:hypothetical protein